MADRQQELAAFAELGETCLGVEALAEDALDG